MKLCRRDYLKINAAAVIAAVAGIDPPASAAEPRLAIRLLLGRSNKAPALFPCAFSYNDEREFFPLTITLTDFRRHARIGKRYFWNQNHVRAAGHARI